MPQLAQPDGQSRNRGGRLRGALLFLLLLPGIPAACAPPQPLAVQLEPAAADPAVRVIGLSGEELTGLRAAVWREESWQALLSVTVKDGDGTPVAGRYVATREALEFHPRFPFDPGRVYRVRLDPARLPTPRAGPPIEEALSLPARPPAPPTVVTAVSPTSDTWPSNMLRFYVHFSAPMSQTQGVEFVRLLDDGGREVAGALLPSAIDFWNPERTRYTVFFDPGRVKRDILPNRQLGRALQPGREYTVVVDPAWRDAQGRPLAAGYRRAFRAGPPIERPLVLSDWKLTPPAAGTLNALVVAFPHPLDEGLLLRAVGVAHPSDRPLQGTVQVAPGEMEWRFVPASPWRAGPHELLVLSVLEDPSGNRIGRAFEVVARHTEDEPPPPEQFTVPFTVK